MNTLHSELQTLVGFQVVSAQLEEYAWTISFTNGFLLTVECLWRLAVAGTLIRTSEDHLQMFGNSTFVDAGSDLVQYTKGQAISFVTFIPGVADLHLEFGPSTKLEIIATSVGYESWHAIFPDGRKMLAVSGALRE